MAMALLSFRLSSPPDLRALRARLRFEVGWRRATEHSVEMYWKPDETGEGGTLDVLSQDGIALAYAGKLCDELGGVSVRGAFTPPRWTRTPWNRTPFTRRVMIWFGRA
jgi:hypothetical protein